MSLAAAMNLGPKTHGHTLSNIKETINLILESTEKWQSQVEKTNSEISSLGENHSRHMERLQLLDPESDEAKELSEIIASIENCYNFKRSRELPLMEHNLLDKKLELQYWQKEKIRFEKAFSQ